MIRRKQARAVDSARGCRTACMQSICAFVERAGRARCIVVVGCLFVLLSLVCVVRLISGIRSAVAFDLEKMATNAGCECVCRFFRSMCAIGRGGAYPTRKHTVDVSLLLSARFC